MTPEASDQQRAGSEEIWLPVLGFEAFYQVSSLGRVRSLRHNKVMSPAAGTGGYYGVTLRGGPKPVLRKVHRLVLEAFDRPRPDGLQAAHLDGNPKNNKRSNLAWVTAKENSSHKRLHGTENYGVRNGFAKLTEADVAEIRRLRAEGVPRDVLCARFGVSPDHLGKVSIGEWWPHLRVATSRPRHNKLTKDDVAEIRRMFAGGTHRAIIADRYGIARDHVNRIVRGQQWSR